MIIDQNCVDTRCMWYDKKNCEHQLGVLVSLLALFLADFTIVVVMSMMLLVLVEQIVGGSDYFGGRVSGGGSHQ